MIIHNVKEGEMTEDKELLTVLKEIYNIEDPTERCLEIVPLITEDYRAWNHLKKNLTPRQLKLTETAIENNPKSYQAWYHRLYFFRADPVLLLEKIDREKQLLEILLKFDSRNFHCWNYKFCLMAILRDLIDVEGEVSDSQIRKLRSSGIKVYPSSVGERVTPHLETIRLIDDHMVALCDIGKDVSNYSYLHFHGDFDSCAAVFTDPFDEGIWMFHCRKMEDFLLDQGLYLRKYRNRAEIHFKEPFSGELTIQTGNTSSTYFVELPTKIYQLKLTGDLENGVIINGRHLMTPSYIPNVSLTDMYSFSDVFNESIFLSDSLFKAIYELEPDCPLNFIFNFNRIKITEEILEKLKKADKIRKPFYEKVPEDLYTTYL